jgi:hypothetical protein
MTTFQHFSGSVFQRFSNEEADAAGAAGEWRFWDVVGVHFCEEGFDGHAQDAFLEGELAGSAAAFVVCAGDGDLGVAGLGEDLEAVGAELGHLKLGEAAGVGPQGGGGAGGFEDRAAYVVAAASTAGDSGAYIAEIVATNEARDAIEFAGGE